MKVKNKQPIAKNNNKKKRKRTFLYGITYFGQYKSNIHSYSLSALLRKICIWPNSSGYFRLWVRVNLTLEFGLCIDVRVVRIHVLEKKMRKECIDCLQHICTVADERRSSHKCAMCTNMSKVHIWASISCVAATSVIHSNYE